MTYPKRLIEVDLPIKRISSHARREKSIRHGHISTLHIWWARRPLAACRAVICASLWPDPADPNCPQSFRDAALKQMTAFAKATQSNQELSTICDDGAWQRYMRLAHGIDIDAKSLKGQTKLRAYLLDFIGDFAAWEASTNHWFLDIARSLTQAAHEALGGEKGTRPLVVDPFAGGGGMPLEALRVGADAFGSDLNPIAALLNKVLLEYIPKYGKRLADAVRAQGNSVRARAIKALADFYPDDPDGGVPIAFLWARTILCEGPSCGKQVPLIRNLQLTRKGERFHLVLSTDTTGVIVSLASGANAEEGTVRNGSVTCPCCLYTTPAKAVKAQLVADRGGAEHPRLLAVYVERAGSRYFREPTEADRAAFAKAGKRLDRARLPNDPINPTRPYKNSRGLSAVTRIGITRFGDLYTPRQALAIVTLQDIVLSIAATADGDPTFNKAVATLLHFVVSRYIFQNCSLSRWNATGAKIEGAFGKQAWQVVWDFVEANPFSDGSANWNNALDWVVEVIEANAILPRPGNAEQAAAQDQVLPDDAADLIATDPPYFAAIPYSDLANVFYVWERELLKRLYPPLYVDGLIDQRREIIVTNANRGDQGQAKSPEYFETEMAKALEAARRTLRPTGVGIVVFADSSTSSWEAILGAIVSAGWTVTSSWPIDTEMQNRTQAQESASLQSSVHIVCRPREDEHGNMRATDVGDWRDVLAELPKRIKVWMGRLSEEGVVGADAIFACLGPALEIFSRYSRVEKASGEAVLLKEYLTYVWGAVAQEALTQIFKEADASGFEEDARLTAMWLWTLNAGASTNGQAAEVADAEVEETSDDDEEQASTSGGKSAGYVLEFDAARKIAQGLGAHLEDLTGVVEVKGDKARLLSVPERTRRLFGKDEADAPQAKRKKKDKQMKLFSLEEVESEEGGWGDKSVPKLGDTTLDRVHQSMILFAAGRGEALRRFLTEDGAGRDQRFWKLANALSALYPQGTDEKRWVDGVLARKKGLGL